MKSIVKNKLSYVLLCVLSVVALCIIKSSTVTATTTVPTDVKKASKGCVLVGSSGSYVYDAEAVLKKMNAYRYEACKKGYRNPNTGKRLTMRDYKPLKWSYDLEYIARIRAAENSVTFSHKRANGKSCFSLASPEGIKSSCEIIAGSVSNSKAADKKSVLSSLKLWYKEKALWNSGKGSFSTTGHYTSMINPDYRYVGVATFTYTYGDSKWAYMSCGEFSGKSKLSTKTIKNTKNCVQTVEVRKSEIKGAVISGDTSIKYGDQTTWKVKLSPKTTRSDKRKLHPIGAVSWKSSNTSVVKINSKGKITAVGVGTVRITVKTKGGYSATRSITVKPPKTGLKSISISKRILTVRWTKQLKWINGYQIQYASNKTFTKGEHIVSIYDKNISLKKIKNIPSSKKHYVRIRTYKWAGGKKIYSSWSSVVVC